MDKSKIIKVGVLLAVGIILFGLLRTLNSPQAPAPAPVSVAAPVEIAYSQVLTAAFDIPLGSRVSEDSFEWKKWPEAALTPSLITQDEQPEAITDYYNAIVRSSIVAGEPVNPSKLVTSGGAGVMAALLNPGMRAVTTRISPDTAAGGFIQPGDRVDIILTESFPVETGENRPGEIIISRIVSAQTIFENVRVLAIDQTFSTSPEGGADIIGSTATFELNPVDVEVLQEAEAVGDLSLTLRGLTGSNSYTRSVANITRGNKPDSAASDTLTLYRSGQAQRVAIEGSR